MNMKMYWPQHKVFFLATVSLFPGSLKDVVLTELFYKPYFAADDINIIELTLIDYAKDGYIEFQKLSKGEFIITKTNSLKATDELTDYLEDWHKGNLKLLAAHKPPALEELQKSLFSALKNAYKPSTKQIRVIFEDMFGTTSPEIYGYPFWETVLSLHFIDLKAKVVSIGYDRRMDGIYNEDAQPYIDLELTDVAFRRSLELAANNSEPIKEDDPSEVSYKDLLLRRDGLISYKGEVVGFTAQERDIMRVFLNRPGELCTKDDFKDPFAGVFKSGHDYPDIDSTLRKQIAATHKKLQANVGRQCINNVTGVGWRLEL